MNNSFRLPTRLWLLGLGLLTSSPVIAQTFYSNGATVFINAGGTLTVNGDLSQRGAALLRTTGAATVAGSLSSAPASTLDLSTGLLAVAGDVAHQGTTAGTTGTLRLSGPAAQRVGLAGGTVPNLTVDKASGTATLAQPLQVRRVLTVAGAGNLATGGQTLTLLSDASGTALLVNSGAGQVMGAATVQRYIDGTRNPGNGYRHYAAPVSNTTVADLATTGFAPVVNAAYNTAAAPGTVTPFPTVFGYDQALLNRTNASSAFDKGWFSPQATTEALEPGRGYAVQIGASELVDFVGTLSQGTVAVPVARNAAGTLNAAEAGFQLLGNPYASPLDFSLMADADLGGLDKSFYVVQSSGPYAGSYRSFINGVPAGGGGVSSSQGFFMHSSVPGSTGTVTFRNSQRVTDYATQPTFQRAAEVRPLVQLDLRSPAGAADAFYAYAEAGATVAFDRRYDAAKLPNSTGLNLAAQLAGGERVAIDGRPAFTAATALPLAVGVPAAGTYELAAAQVLNLPAGLVPYLRDAQTGTTTALSAGSSYRFTVSAAEAAALVQGRFTLQFAAATPLAASSAALAAAVALYPNPARTYATVVVPGLVGATAVQLDLLNALGQVVRRQQAALPAAGATCILPTADLASGVYVLRLTAGAACVAKRLTIE